MAAPGSSPPPARDPRAHEAAPDRYAVVGNPVAHSQSPFIHAAFARQTGQAIVYERVLAPRDGFAAAVRAFADAGGRGCNVTVPFKFEACAIAPRRSERAALAEAANVLRFDAEGWWADNTDGVGLVADIRDRLTQRDSFEIGKNDNLPLSAIAINSRRSDRRFQPRDIR